MGFDVSYGQLHSGMGPVEGVCFGRGQFGAGGEGVVSPVGPQLRLGGICQPGGPRTTTRTRRCFPFFLEATKEVSATCASPSSV